MGFSLLFLFIIVVFKEINERSVIDAVLNIAGYTYGPLLGLFSFGIFTTRRVRDNLVPFVCVASPVLSYLISTNLAKWFGGYEIGLEVLLVNGAITFLGLWLVSTPSEKELDSALTSPQRR